MPPGCQCTLPVAWLLGDGSRAQGRVHLSDPTLGHKDGAKMESQERPPATQGTGWQLRVRSPPWLSPFPPGGAKQLWPPLVRESGGCRAGLAG